MRGCWGSRERLQEMGESGRETVEETGVAGGPWLDAVHAGVRAVVVVTVIPIKICR